MMETKDLLKTLEEMPLGKSIRLKIGENEQALKFILKDPANKGMTMCDIKEHNIKALGYDEGYSAAIEKLKEWRNEQFLKIKGLS